MKLILCLECQDVVRLIVGKDRSCECGLCRGRYVDKLNAVIDGPCVPLGFNNRQLGMAVREKPPAGGYGPRFEAFVIPPDAESVVHTNPPTERLERLRKARETALARDVLEMMRPQEG